MCTLRLTVRRVGLNPTWGVNAGVWRVSRRGFPDCRGEFLPDPTDSFHHNQQWTASTDADSANADNDP